jgi:hypothetical protein
MGTIDDAGPLCWRGRRRDSLAVGALPLVTSAFRVSEGYGDSAVVRLKRRFRFMVVVFSFSVAVLLAVAAV